jgi:hypothetical protein
MDYAEIMRILLILVTLFLLTIMRILLILVTLFLLTTVSAGVYRSVDEDGNIVYTDKPSADAEKIRIDKVQTIPAGAADFEYTPPEKSAGGDYTKLEIVNPENNHVFTGNTGDVTVSVVIEPELNTENGDRLILTMDGKKEADSTSTSFSFTNLDRGTHTIEVHVVNKDGKSLISSAPVTFTIKRTSVLNTNRPTPRPSAN